MPITRIMVGIRVSDNHGKFLSKLTRLCFGGTPKRLKTLIIAYMMVLEYEVSYLKMRSESSAPEMEANKRPSRVETTVKNGSGLASCVMVDSNATFIRLGYY